MKSVLRYTLIFLLFCSGPLFAQKKKGDTDAVPTSFPDSVRIALENARNVDATIIAGSFFSAWNSLDPSQQQLIQRQTARMKRKKLPLRPAMMDYYGAIANAVSIEHADPSKITAFLKVADKVIDQEKPEKARLFFHTSRGFFQLHALHYEKSFRLYARDDDYRFDYIEPAPVLSWDDTTHLSQPTASTETTPTTETTDTSDQQDTYDSTQQQDEMPGWMSVTPSPTQEGPVIRFNRITLGFTTNYDSTFLKNSKGIFSLRDNNFVGEGGTFDWTPAHLRADSVYATFTTYFFNVARPDLKVDMAKLNYLGRTPGMIAGTFEFKSPPRRDSVASSYPRFKSFQSTHEIQGIGDANVHYVGGFSLTGRKISSASVSGDESRIEVFHNGDKKFEARSPEFFFTDSTISSKRSRINILQGSDSIVHKAVSMRYTYGVDSTQRLFLRKDKGDMMRTPYVSTFFNVDFSADVLKWDLYSDSLDISTDGGRNTVPVIVESTSFYDPEDFRLLKGEGFSFHPLTLFANYGLRNHVREFYLGDLISSSNKNPEEIKKAAEYLNQKGMIDYDVKHDRVKFKRKTTEFFLASKGESDYDNLKIHSVIDSLPNLTVNFPKRYMTVHGVGEFRVSDSLNVRIKPDSATITILQDRDIKFDGTINAGNFEISGKDFTLKYDSFYITLQHIDSINFFVTEKNARGVEVRRKVNNSMVGADSTAAKAGGLGDITRSSGTLFISRANNKSGKEKIPNYPRLDATTGGVIYFDRQEVLSGVYDRSMFFVVPPFKLDSLNDADPASINFDGTFVSSGMFPNFKEKLHTQPDKSLGFSHMIDKDGYQLYKGDGKMHGTLNMDNKGLRGFGRIDYLAASVSSEDFIFYPDSVIGRGKRARIAEKQFGNVIFPQASLPDYDMKWFPKEDKMRLKNMKAPFNFYDSTAQMQGMITISKAGVAGAGKLETRGTELVSRTMNFSAKDFSARHARFKVKTSDPTKPLLAGNDIRLKFNLEQNYADISPEVAGAAAIDFPYAQFKTSIPKMRWDLTAQKIIMSKDKDEPLENSYFYATRKELDSLHFNADHAEYDLKTQQLKVSGIPYIIVADAKITPENNEVLILENAKIGTLKNTTIILDTLNGYHRLTEGVVDIVSRKEFTGYATYQYVNALSDTFAIKMTNFHLEPVAPLEAPSRRSQREDSPPALQTVATGSVTDKDKVVLGAGMFYKGDLTMYATRPALQLTGYVKLDIKKLKNYNTWIKYDQSGDSTEVQIDFDNAVTEEGKRVVAGLHFAQADNNLYISFLNDKKSEEDDDFFVPSGALFYDVEAKEYRIEDSQKAAGNKLSGKVFAYNDETSQVRFEGPVALLAGSKDFNITATTLGSGNVETNEIRMNSFLIMDSNVPSTAFDVMGKNIQDIIKNEGADEGLGDQTELLYKIADIVGERLAKDYEQKSLQNYVSLSTLPPLVKPVVFSNVMLKWSQKQKAFYSEGNLGISNIGRNDINGAFEGFMEVKKNQDGVPIFHVFFKASPEAWYYFGFEDNRLLVHSSNSEFNSIITKKTNSGKVKIGEVAFIPGSDDETLAFINRFRKEYYGIDVPYSLSEGTAAPVGTKKKETEEKKKEDDGF